MALLDIPPFVLADEDPPSSPSEVRTFHLRSYQLLQPIDFPRHLFTDVLAEHARLLEAHGPEILAAPLDHPGKPADERFVEPENHDFVTTVLACDGATHEVHKWRTVDASYVLQRCRGIVRRLMEVPPHGVTYVVVIAGQVASLHALRVEKPRRVGEPARLQVVARDLIVEPWDQWHRREGGFVTTSWKTPAGERVASRVPVRPWPSDARAIVDALMTIRGSSIRERLEAFARESPRIKPLVLLDSNPRGDEIDVLDRRFGGEPYVDAFPAIIEALRTPRPGLVPVLVFGWEWAGLCWLASEAGADVALPELLIAERTPQPGDGMYDDEEEDEEAEKAPKPKPKMRLGRHARMRALLLDDFPPLEPWAPRARDAHAAWKTGLLLAVFVALFGLVLARFLLELQPDMVWRATAVATLVMTGGGCVITGLVLRGRLRDLDPAYRRLRWRAWKQVQEELNGAARPAKPKPRAPRRKFWMKRLAQRLSRLERFVDLHAPEPILEHAQKLVRDAIAELDPSDARSVLAAWPRAARFHARAEQGGDRNKSGTDKPN